MDAALRKQVPRRKHLSKVKLTHFDSEEVPIKGINKGNLYSLLNLPSPGRCRSASFVRRVDFQSRDWYKYDRFFESEYQQFLND